MDKVISTVRRSVSDRVDELRPIDDVCGAVFFEDIECTQILLQSVLEKPTLKLVKSSTQETRENIFGRGGRLDVLAYDDANGIYNIEFQTSKEGAVVDRAIFNQALIVRSAFDKGTAFRDFPYTSIMFVLDKDYFAANKPTAKVLFVLDGEKRIPLKSNLNIVYANENYQDKSTALGRVMHDMFCSDAKEMLTPEFADRMEKIKHPMREEREKMLENLTGWRKEMLDDMMEECREKLQEEYREKVQAEVEFKAAINMLKNGISVSKVVKILELSAEQKQRLIKEYRLQAAR